MPDVSLCFNVKAPSFFSSSSFSLFHVTASPLTIATERLESWNFPIKTQKRITPVLEEWYSNSTLEKVLSLWENKPSPSATEFIPLKVLTYNVQGWGTRALEAMDLIFKVDSPICVFTEVGELWNSFKVPQFTSFYQKGTNHSGGVMLMIGKHLKATRIDTDLENTVIVDVDGLSDQVRIIGIYWPQGQVRNLNDLRPFLVKGTILTGDFNATAEEWGSHTTDKRGGILRNWIVDNELLFVPTTSHTSKRSNRNIDLTFTNLNSAHSVTMFHGTSDHWPTVMTSESVGFYSKGFFPHIDWKVYQTILVLLEDFWTREQKNQTYEQWYQGYVRFLAALKCRLTQWKEREKYRPSLPPLIVEQLRRVRHIRNSYYRERKKTGVGNEELRVLLRTVTKDARIEIYKYKAERWASFLSSIQESHDKPGKVFWSHLSKVYKAKTLPFSKLAIGARIISDVNEITKELFEYSKEQAIAPNIDPLNSHDIQVVSDYNEIKKLLATPIEIEIEATSVAEVTKIIKKMKGKKSSGCDQVSNHIIKLLSPTYIQCLVNCFNSWLKELRFPDCWKTAKIIMLNKLKCGVPKCNQTRPISLLATHSKLFEKVLLDRTRQWAEGNRLVPPEQSGFRPKCLLPTRVLSIYQEVKNNLSANAPTLAIYVDYEKAYDRVWHIGLLVKLFRLRIPTSLLKIINSWLENRTAYISFGKEKSMEFRVQVGLPQGSSLSPYLFVVYHSDLVSCLGAHSGHLFADDLCVLIRAPLQKSFPALVKYLEQEGSRVSDRIADYSNRWKQPINVGKTVAQIFYSQVKQPTVEIYMLGQKLEVVNSFKYLGFTWTSKLSLKPTVNRCLENIQKSLGKLKWLRSGKTVSKSVLRKCFFAYTFPHFAWIFPFFPFLPKTQQEALRRKFRVAIRYGTLTLTLL